MNPDNQPWYRINSPVDYERIYSESVASPENFWAKVADEFTWHQKWDDVLQWDFTKPEVKWFLNAKLNITENCIDRHLNDRGNKTAILWEPNDPNEKAQHITYQQLHENVCRFANILKKYNVKKGDRVCLYMPMIPELAYAVLACARIGAVHSVVFAGFSAKALADRINDASANMVLTSDGAFRGDKSLILKNIVDEALESCACVEHVIVTKRTSDVVNMKADRDIWLHDEWNKVSADCPAESMDAEDMLFILYTSGSTGKPKGIVHTCGGYMVYADFSFRNVFQYNEKDIYWCTADIGWITGHSYIVYGPLLAGATTVMFEGVPTYPNPGRFWEVVQKHKVNQFYTAPTAIRALMACGEDIPDQYDLSSLRTIGTVGEPINEEAWNWYYNKVGRDSCPVVDTWWQTETGGIMISALGEHSSLKPTYAGNPLPGIQPVILDKDGNEQTEPDKEGYLAMKFPWPSMLRTTYGNHDRCRDTYFSQYTNHYFTGDGAKRDSNGMFRIIGRVDDVINVSGHRLGTAEIENAINLHSEVVESAVVGYPHDIKGQGIYAYVICLQDINQDDGLRKEIVEQVVTEIGKIARPEKIQFVTGLPKTRSGKIMRRILRKVAEGDFSNLGDISTLLDPSVVDSIIKSRIND